MTKEPLLSWSIQSIRRGGIPAMALFCFHVIVSRGFDAYDRFPPLDIPMHFLGGVAIAYFFYRTSLAASAHGVIGPFHRVTHTVLVFALTCMATVFWEFAEFLSDRFFGTHAQLGLEDTLFDMFLGIFGGVLLLIVTTSIDSRNQSHST